MPLHPQVEKPSEVWTRDPEDPDLWHAPSGLMLNSAALAERESYFRIERRLPTALERRAARKVF